MIHLQAICFSILTVLLLGAPARADEVFLHDGSRLNGTIRNYTADALVLETGFAGTIEIDRAQVAGISSDRKLTVALASGDRIVARPRFTPGRGQELTETSFGNVEVDEGAVVGAWAPGESPEKQALAKMEANPWSARAEAGLTGSAGNTDRVSMRARASALRDTGGERLTLFIDGRYAEEDGEETERQISGGADLEVDFAERWFGFGRIELEHDEFENLDLRTTVTGGLGYFLIQDIDQILKLRGGLGYEHSSFVDGTSESNAVGSLGYEYRRDFREWLRLTHDLTWFPAFSGPFSDYRVEVETAVEIPLGKRGDWKVRAGVENDYDNDPTAGADKLDTLYFLNLVYDFD